MNDIGIPLCAGAIAGLAVDLSLFPIDTIKTRLQAQGGLGANGGYRGLYKGMGSIAAGSGPGAALFFLGYEVCKKYLPLQQHDVLLAICSGSIAETLACLVRTPTEVVKQRAQTSQATSYSILRNVLARQGVRGLYRGFGGTLAREIPFVAIQFPLWEYLKRAAVRERGASQPHMMDLHSPAPRATPAEAALCGALAGAVAAGLTTPMDVIKTRLMLAENTTSWSSMLRTVIEKEGLVALTKGIGPRISWISLGGFIFLGGYSAAHEVLRDVAGS